MDSSLCKTKLTHKLSVQTSSCSYWYVYLLMNLKSGANGEYQFPDLHEQQLGQEVCKGSTCIMAPSSCTCRLRSLLSARSRAPFQACCSASASTEKFPCPDAPRACRLVTRLSRRLMVSACCSACTCNAARARSNSAVLADDDCADECLAVACTVKTVGLKLKVAVHLLTILELLIRNKLMWSWTAADSVEGCELQYKQAK
jgi:hypothetical protein